MADDKSNQEPTTAPEVTKGSASKTVVSPSAVKSDTKAKPVPVEDNSMSPEPTEEQVETPIPEAKPGSTLEPEKTSTDKSESTPPPKKDFTPPKKPRDKKKLILVLVALIVLAALGYLAWSMMGKKTNDSGTSTGAQNNQQTEAPQLSYDPVSVVYAYKGDDKSPYTLYTRPVGGGDRVAANLKLSANDNISSSDVKGSNVVVEIADNVYVSTDGGKNYKSILKVNENKPTTEMGNQITSLKFSTDGKSIVYGWLRSDPRKNQVKTMDLTGQNTKVLFESSSAGVFIGQYSSQANKITYSEGCYNCDGNINIPVTLRDLKTNKTSTIGNTDKALETVASDYSDDLSKYIYVTAVIDNSESEGIGNATFAPYTVYVQDLASLKSTKIAGFGTAGEKNPNGTRRSRIVHAGFVAGTNTPYYTSDSQLYEIKSDKPSLVYEVKNNILYLPFVGENMIIVGDGSLTSDYILSSYDLSSKKASKIYSGDDNTYIFGVATE